ncbi:MAG TPA: sigma-70 family RNA polymerase sigma factor [Gemmataceae bacterium]|jgi:RNA polymerase sigma-70 factor (ECF subfamily)|nr:sigma-70 family RNA polymerase sigma factor [Gemmataceae bacterium]
MERISRIFGVVDIDRGGLVPDNDAASYAKCKLFLRLFLQNERRLYAYIFTLIHNQTDSDDLLQETSLVLWDKFDALNPPDDFAAWACRVAYFKVLDFSKKRQRSRVLFGQALLERLAETAIEQSSALQLDERRDALISCIEKLSVRDRELLGWRFAEGGSTRSAAAQAGKRVDAVYKSLARIRKALFECVTRAVRSERLA